MQGAARQCELAGCSTPIEDIPGRPARRYCSPEHRAAARRSRRAASAVAHAARLEEALPWLRDGGPGRVPEQVDRVAAAAQAPPGGPSVADAGVEPPDFGPSVAAAASCPPPAHRGRVHPAGRLLASAWSAPSGWWAGRSCVPVAASPDRAEPPGRLRGLAVLGAAAVLIGSYTVTAADSASRPIAVPVQVVPVGETHAQWAARAERALASTNEQLDVIADTEVAWSRIPETERTAARRAPIEALEDRKLLLMQRQVVLSSQLEIYRQLLEAQRQLVLTEQQLAPVEAALRDAPPAGQRSPEQIYARAVLIAQRDLHVQQRDTRRQEVQRLDEVVAAAARTPLPADDAHTAMVSDLVLQSLDSAQDPEPRGLPRAGRPGVVDNRADDGLARVGHDILAHDVLAGVPTNLSELRGLQAADAAVLVAENLVCPAVPVWSGSVPSIGTGPRQLIENVVAAQRELSRSGGSSALRLPERSSRRSEDERAVNLSSIDRSDLPASDAADDALELARRAGRGHGD